MAVRLRLRATFLDIYVEAEDRRRLRRHASAPSWVSEGALLANPKPIPTEADAYMNFLNAKVTEIFSSAKRCRVVEHSPTAAAGANIETASPPKSLGYLDGSPGDVVKQDMTSPTSLMIYDLPGSVLEQRLASIVGSLGFAGKYDFIYVPSKNRSKGKGLCSLGYGFINFLDPKDLDVFAYSIDGYSFEGTPSQKTCKAKVAHVQGSRNLRRLLKENRK